MLKIKDNRQCILHADDLLTISQDGLPLAPLPDIARNAWLARRGIPVTVVTGGTYAAVHVGDGADGLVYYDQSTTAETWEFTPLFDEQYIEQTV